MPWGWTRSWRATCKVDDDGCWRKLEFAAEDDDVAFGLLLLSAKTLGLPPFPVDQELGVPLSTRVSASLVPLVDQRVNSSADFRRDIDHVAESWWNRILVVHFSHDERLDFCH